MKKQIIYTVLAGLSMMTVSCDDFLMTESRSTMPEEKIFSTEANTKLAVFGIYAAIAKDRVYGQRVSTYFPYNNDIEFALTNAAPEDNRRGLWDYTATSSNSDLDAWGYIYTAINRANECVNGIEKGPLLAGTSPVAASNIRHMYGEAKALRALMYLELVRNWGDVPFKTAPTKFDDDFFIEATNRDTILTFLINDLIAAEPAMYYANEVPESVERFNRGAVQALIARLALTRGGWSLRPNTADPSDKGYMHRPSDYLDYYRIANTYCKKLYESGKHQLVQEFKQVFVNQAQEIYPSGDDMLYEVAFATGYSGAIGHYVGQQIDNNAYSTCGYSNVWYYVTLPYLFSFDQYDKRRDVTCTPYKWVWNTQNNRLEQEIVDWNKIPIGKWSKQDMKTLQGIGAQTNTGINFPILRYTDALLMLAETENEINGSPTELAREALKTVRKRAFAEANQATMVDAYVADLTDKVAFFQAVAQERAWEFAGEAIRKYDLIRWGMIGKALRDMKETSYQIGVDCRKKTGVYANYPAYLYYKLKDDGTLDIVGFNQNMSSAPVGYTAKGMGRELVTETTSGGVTTHTLRSQLDQYFRASVIDQEPMVYLYPLHKDVIGESGGKLRNYYGKE